MVKIPWKERITLSDRPSGSGFLHFSSSSSSLEGTDFTIQLKTVFRIFSDFYCLAQLCHTPKVRWNLNLHRWVSLRNWNQCSPWHNWLLRWPFIYNRKPTLSLFLLVSTSSFSRTFRSALFNDFPTELAVWKEKTVLSDNIMWFLK